MDIRRLGRYLSVTGVLALVVGWPHGSADAKGKQRITAAEAPSQEEYFSTAEKGISSADRKKADSLRVRTLRSIDSLLDKKSVKGSKRFELLLRQGELYSERHDYVRDQEYFEFSQAHDKWLASGKKGKEPELSSRQSQSLMAKAANSFRKLVREFPKHPRTAAALYSLGKTLSRLGDDSAVLYFSQLIKNHRQSPLIPDAYLALGEYFFEKHDMDKAVENYRQMMKYKKHLAYPYAIYKMGWAHFDRDAKNSADQKRNYDKAIASFKLVIRLADRDRKNSKAGRLMLRDEAVKDLVMVWAETEDTGSAWSYFKRIGEKDSFYNLLEILGGHYADSGKNQKAIDLYGRLLKEAPGRSNNHTIHEKIVQLYDARGNYKGVVDSLDQMVATYTKNSPWIRANSKDKSLLKEADQLTEFNLRRYGTMYHQRGQKTKQKSAYAAASLIYATYLKNFSKNDNAYEIRYLYADVQFEFKKYEIAAGEYSTVAKQKGKYRDESAMNAVIAIATLDKAQKYGKLPPSGQVPKPLKIPRVKQQLVEVMDQYVQLLPNSDKGHPMRYTAAQIYFDYGHYDEAVKRFEGITKDIPQTKQAESAAKYIVGFQLEKNNWKMANRLAKQFLANKKLASKSLKAYLVDSLKKSMYSEALELEKLGKHAEAGKAFLAYQREFSGDSKNADRALHNSSVNFYKAGMLEDALAVNKKLIEKYPKSKQVPEAILNIAQTNEALANFDKAADYYKAYGVSYPNDSKAPPSLFNAATLYKGLKNYKEALSLYDRYVKFYPKADLALDVRFEIAAIEEKIGNHKGAVASYSKAASAASNDPDRAYFAWAKSAVLTKAHVSNAKGTAEVERIRSKLAAKGSPNAYEARRLVAEAMFNELNPGHREFISYKLTDGKKIEAQVTTKQNKLKSLASKYQQVIEVGSPEYVVAALYRLGELHEDFANSLFNAPAPKGASQVEINQFRSSVEKVAFPLKEDAYKFYETAFKRSQEVETFTVWTRRTYDKMHELAPDKHPQVVEQSADPAYMVHRVSLEPAISSLVH